MKWFLYLLLLLSAAGWLLGEDRLVMIQGRKRWHIWLWFLLLSPILIYLLWVALR